jgi:ribosomal protein S18 acetylase RimI-like enzyme
MTPIQITRQARFGSPHADQLHAIYDDSFPSYERAEFSFLRDSIAAGTRWLYTATRDDDLLGFAIVVPHITREVHLLEYLAVSRDARGSGIGGILLTQVVSAIRDAQSAIGLILEVEPDDEGNADERALRARRIAFYRRHGARSIDGAPDYRVPLADRAGTMRMKLLWLPLAANAAAPRGDNLRECVAGILEKSYGVK